MTVITLNTATLNANAFRILDNVDQSHALNIIANENLGFGCESECGSDGWTRNMILTGNVTLSGTNTGKIKHRAHGRCDRDRHRIIRHNDRERRSDLCENAERDRCANPWPIGRLQWRCPGDYGWRGIDSFRGALTATAGGTTWTDIGDARSGDTAIALGAFETDFTSTIDSAGKAVWTITNTDADAAADNAFIDLRHNDGADANVFYMRLIGDNDGTPVNDYLFSQTAFTIGLASRQPLAEQLRSELQPRQPLQARTTTIQALRRLLMCKPN